jgi:hypothetical protein
MMNAPKGTSEYVRDLADSPGAGRSSRASPVAVTELDEVPVSAVGNAVQLHGQPRSLAATQC